MTRGGWLLPGRLASWMGGVRSRYSAKTQVPPLRFAPVGMTRGRAALPGRVVAGQELFFITLGAPRPMIPPVGMTRVELLATLELLRGWRELPETLPIQNLAGYDQALDFAGSLAYRAELYVAVELLY